MLVSRENDQENGKNSKRETDRGGKPVGSRFAAKRPRRRSIAGIAPMKELLVFEEKLAILRSLGLYVYYPIQLSYLYRYTLHEQI